MCSWNLCQALKSCSPDPEPCSYEQRHFLLDKLHMFYGAQNMYHISMIKVSVAETIDSPFLCVSRTMGSLVLAPKVFAMLRVALGLSPLRFLYHMEHVL